MECKKCGNMLPANAIFCGKCGSRSDGKVPCKKCGHLIAKSNIYCDNCGTQIDGKEVCQKCGAVYDGNFCPICGQKNNIQEQLESKQKSDNALNLIKKMGKLILGARLSNLIAIVGAFISLICVFFIGMNIPAGYIIQNTTALTEVNVLFFFNGYYILNDISAYDQTIWIQNLIKTQVEMIGVLGIIISALTVGLVILFTIIAFVKHIHSERNHIKNDSFKFSIASMITFIIGTVTLYFYSRNILNSSVIELNNAALAGTTLTSICLIAWIALTYFHDYKKICDKQNNSLIVCSVIGIVFTVILLGLTRSFGISYGNGDTIGFLAYNMNRDSSFSYISSNMSSKLSSLTSEIEYSKMTDLLSDANIFNAMSQILAIIYTIILGIAFAINFYGMQGNKKSGLACPILLILISILIVVFTKQTQLKISELAQMINDSGGSTRWGEPKFQYASIIMTIIFSALLLIETIVRMIFASKQKTLSK